MRILFLVPGSRFTHNVARDLLYGCWCKGKRIAGAQFPPVSQLLVATLLRDSGHQVDLLDTGAEPIDRDELDRQAKEHDLVIILTSFMTINEDCQVLLQMKTANPALCAITYGNLPTFTPKLVLARSAIDIIILGEPEFILRDLLAAMEAGGETWKEIAGIGFRENESLIIRERYPFINPLDLLPIPDRSMLPRDVHYYNPLVKRVPFTTAFTTRGCPARCAFCASPAFYGHTVRMRSAARVLEELEIISAQGYREVFFRDEVFTASRNRVMEICAGIRERGLDLSWICSSRVDQIDREMLREMKQSGCHMVRLGVESGVQEILDAVDKGVTVEQTRQAFALLHQAGLDSHAHCMLGMPNDTPATIRQTLEFILEIDPTVITFGICTPYPGTALYQQVARHHPEILDGSACDLRGLHTQAFYSHVFTAIPPGELSRILREIYRRFYLRPSYLLGWLKRVRDLDELRRVAMAGAQIVDFVVRGDVK